MMAAVAARELADGEVVFVGIGLPKPGVQSGAAHPRRRIWCSSTSRARWARHRRGFPSRSAIRARHRLAHDMRHGRCVSAVSPERAHRGRFLGGAQVDRRGNINTHRDRAYERPKVRLPGSAAPREIADSRPAHPHRRKLSPRGFPERVDFLTSPGQRRRQGDHRPGRARTRRSERGAGCSPD